MDKNKSTKQLYLRIIVVVGGLIILFIGMEASGILDNMTSVDALRGYIKGYGENAYIVFFVIQLLSVIIAPIPSHISTLVGAVIFGMWVSFIISSLAIIIGSAIVFIMARKLGKPFTDRIIGAKVSDKYKKHITSGRGETVLALLLFLPFFPDDAICFLAGLSKIRTVRFFVIMLLTRPWGILAASALGSSGMSPEWWGWGSLMLIIFFAVKYCDVIERRLLWIVNVKKSPR